MPDASALPAVYLQSQISEVYNLTGTSMAELIESLFHFNFNEGHFHNETEVAGINAVLWLGCGKKNGIIMQVFCIRIFIKFECLEIKSVFRTVGNIPKKRISFSETIIHCFPI